MAQASDLTKEHYLTTVLKVAEKTAHERDSLSVAVSFDNINIYLNNYSNLGDTKLW